MPGGLLVVIGEGEEVGLAPHPAPEDEGKGRAAFVFARSVEKNPGSGAADCGKTSPSSCIRSNSVRVTSTGLTMPVRISSEAAVRLR